MRAPNSIEAPQGTKVLATAKRRRLECNLGMDLKQEFS
jgi:hypothetical protein